MVKVLCRGGPAFWIKEPYTPVEQAYEDAIKRGERPKAPEGYDEDWMLMDNEVWPWTEDEEAEYWKGFGEIKHIGFYGGAPHKPNPSAQSGRSPSPAADSGKSSPPLQAGKRP